MLCQILSILQCMHCHCNISCELSYSSLNPGTRLSGSRSSAVLQFLDVSLFQIIQPIAADSQRECLCAASVYNKTAQVSWGHLSKIQHS